MTTPLPIDEPGAVRRGEELDEARLAAYLRERLPGADGPLHVAQFPGGYSNLTYLLRLGPRELVLRRPPPGVNVRGGHDMGREFRVLEALLPVFSRVPRPLLFCADPEVLGAPFYVMERVRGLILRAPLAAEAAPAPEDLRRVGVALVETLADLHALDWRAAGLAELGRPAGYTARQVAGWARRYRDARTDDVPALERAARWLEERAPAEHVAALIHNDFKHDNAVLNPADPAHILAVLDWEMATVGDPLTDLGTTLAYWFEPGDPPALVRFGLAHLPGSPGRREVAETYARRAGGLPGDLVFGYVYGLFKNAVIIQQIYARYRAGHTADPRFAGLAELVTGYGALAARAIELGRIDGLF